MPHDEHTFAAEDDKAVYMPLYPYWSPPPRAGSRPLLQISARGACGGAVLNNPIFLRRKPHASPFPSNPFADGIGEVPH